MKYLFILLTLFSCTNPSNQPAPVDSVQPAQRVIDSVYSDTVTGNTINPIIDMDTTRLIDTLGVKIPVNWKIINADTLKLK